MEVMRYLTTKEAAELYRVHPETIKKWARAGKIPGKKIGARKWLFPAEDLVFVPEPGKEV